MDFNVRDIQYRSYNKLNTIHGKITSPYDTSKIKGIVQISHGMSEYIEKYDEFAKFLASNGYIVCGNDHLGHGQSISSSDGYGFFGIKDGYKSLIEDAYSMTKIVKKEFSNLPYFLFGHSMGSFIARCYASKYGDKLNGLILCGTAGPNPLLKAGIQMADYIMERKGPMYRSRKLEDLSFNFANINFQPVTSKYDWISRDIEVVRKHEEDKKSCFTFTTAGFKDLFYLLKYCNDDKWIRRTSKNIPIYIFSGDKDPVGENGDGVKKVYQNYKKAGCKDVTLKLYPGCRHELLNELNKQEVYNEIFDWLELVRFSLIEH